MGDIEKMAKACEAASKEKASLKMSMVADKVILAEEHENAKSLLQAAAFIRAHAWRPIETAPKSGERVLLHPSPNANDVACIGYWSTNWRCWMTGNAPIGVRPTDWQPLPAPPKSK
jgi:hypothetical protein